MSARQPHQIEGHGVMFRGVLDNTRRKARVTAGARRSHPAYDCVRIGLELLEKRPEELCPRQQAVVRQ